MKGIVTEIEINALPDQVCHILTGFEKHTTWNPFVKKIAGKPVKDVRIVQGVHVC